MAIATPLQLIYGGISLHDYGEVSIMSQGAQFSQEDLPQKESRQLHIRIESWNRGYDLNYAAMRALRNACAKQMQVLKWVTPGINGSAGQTQLERPAKVLSHDLPEDPNSWGTYEQQINIIFAYELDRKDSNVHLSAFVQGQTDPVSLGHVHTFGREFRNNFFDEWHNERQRSSGVVSATGELFFELGETGGTNDTRRSTLLAISEQLKLTFEEGKQIDLTYGLPGNPIFDQTVRVDSFLPQIDQLENKIRWSLSCSYTIFPDENGYAFADFTSTLGDDKESGDETLTVSGRVRSTTEVLAMAKLNSLLTAVESAYGFAAVNRIRQDRKNDWINCDDSGDVNKYMSMEFNYSYRKRAADILSYTLTISDADDTVSGMLRRTYSGSVVASGADADSAYSTALTKARLLGDKKHEFRMNSEEVRDDRQVQDSGPKEFVKLNFSYSYKVKGTRMYLEMRSSVQEDAFGESREIISGFCVAVDETTARASYATNVKAAYAGRIIRQEATEVGQEKIQLASQWFATGTLATLFSRLDFNFAVFKSKANATYGMKYGLKITTDFTKLLQSASISGIFVGSPAYLAAIEAQTDNPLDTFLQSYVAQLGGRGVRDIEIDTETTGTLTDRIAVRFSATYTKKASGTATILSTELSEVITYSNTRWVFLPSPQGADTPQDLGITQATRTVSGSITAATEGAAESWLTIQRSSDGLLQKWPTGTPGGAPATAKEMAPQVTRNWAVPDMVSGIARGTGLNFRTIQLGFTFSQVIPNLQPPWA